MRAKNALILKHFIVPGWIQVEEASNMENLKTDPDNGNNQKPQISLPRKIIIWAFIIGFWVFFYWYKTPEFTQDQEPPQASPKEQKVAP